MINAGINNNGVDNGGVAIPAYKLGGGGAGIPPAQDKQQPAAKKTALRDLQNQNGGIAQNHLGTFSFLGGGLSTDAVKVCGNKRLTPERPPSSTFYPALNNSCANEHIINARRRFELELDRGSIQSKVNKAFECSPQTRQLHQLQLESPKKRAHPRTHNNYGEPVGTGNNVVPTMTNSFGGPSPPNLLGKYGPGMQAAHTDSLKVTLQYPSYVNLKPTGEEQRTERFICLQKFLKECDESKCRDYVQRLRHLSLAELSRSAVELEKRAIQLTIEEGKEMQRMKTLNVLGKSVLTNNPNQKTQLLNSRK